MECVLVPILGNHDENMLEARTGGERLRNWLRVGGDAALASYGKKATVADMPAAHFAFLEGCLSYHETDTHVFTHGNYDPKLPFDLQNERTLRYLSLRNSVPGPHCSGKIVVVGHTNQKEVLNLGHLLCIDTGCCYGRKLTAYDVEEQRLWQIAAQRASTT
ncbi:MAG: serine/threonine protein phosphatase [Pirellulales bacterium]